MFSKLRHEYRQPLHQTTPPLDRAASELQYTSSVSPASTVVLIRAGQPLRFKLLEPLHLLL